MHGPGYLYPNYLEILVKDLNSQELPNLDVEFEYIILDRVSKACYEWGA